eukprot:gnl/TRDRNA2_/TRDRNA2_158415_c1_seq1.p1 gnl/TRDRNA2_/TRDRNA2_158415_c1~~gnl/TRDRNA2_/TRDRNA2_158415_c1_seq1.p1  ORF type:complete len:113 (+),score=6.09 gnl/TRDRNA2_/TRDRNA2_158415_c1_seq1:345-683(+)
MNLANKMGDHIKKRRDSGSSSSRGGSPNDRRRRHRSDTSSGSRCSDRRGSPADRGRGAERSGRFLWEHQQKPSAIPDIVLFGLFACSGASLAFRHLTFCDYLSRDQGALLST